MVSRAMPPYDETLFDEADEDPEMVYRRKSLLAHILLHGPLPVATVDLRYEPGGYVAWNGVKGGGPRGYGWSSCGLLSRYLLVAIGPEGEIEIRIDRTFKQAIGRLTSKRRGLIRGAMPATVTLVTGDDPWYGRRQLLVSPKELAHWVEEVKAMLPTRAKTTGFDSRAS